MTLLTDSGGRQVGTADNPLYVSGGTGGGGGGGGGANPAQDGTDATGASAPAGATGIRGWLSGIFTGIGTPGDAAWGSGAGSVVALLKAVVGKLASTLAVTINGALPPGTNAIGTVGANQAGLWFESPFQPIVGATSGLNVGPTATTTPLALGTYTATSYRIRNASSSASIVAWRLNTTTPGTAAVVPVAATTAGTGATLGDKSIEPGGVEVFTLTAAQQTAWAAGTLYLSAITPAGGSATIYITPGIAGA